MNSGQGDANLLNKGSIVASLHAILKPFLLRRLKVDVEKDLPPKKEYLLYAPLTQQQKDIYQAIVSRQIRQYLVDKKSGREEEPIPEPDQKPEVLDETDVRQSRKKARVNYKIEENDTKYIRDLEDGVAVDEPSGVVEKSAAEIGKDWAVKQASKYRGLRTGDAEPRCSQACEQHAFAKFSHAAAKGQLGSSAAQTDTDSNAQISSHPFLFDWPADPLTGQLVVNDDLVNASGKMLLLNRLLVALFERGHKVLLFSQFTTMLDVIVRFVATAG